MTDYNINENALMCLNEQYAETALDKNEQEICFDAEPLCVEDCGAEDLPCTECACKNVFADSGHTSKSLRVGAKFSLRELVNAQVEVDFDSEKSGADGYAQGCFENAAANGYRGHAVAKGFHGRAAVSGEDAIAAALGIKGRAKASLGSWIALAEWERIKGKWRISAVKTAQIDGEKLKADTWYILRGGEFAESR